MIEYVSHRMIEPKKVESILYQQTIFATCVKNNTLVILPTALGKTVISLLTAVNRLEQYGWSKVVILAPTVPLVSQHRKSFQDLLVFDGDKMTTLTGKIRPTDREILWNSSQLIFMTPQTLANDLKAGRYKLDEVSLIVFDEAHRSRRRYAYNYVADIYVRQCSDPLILGLTASPGWDREKIEGICKNLFIEAVEYRTDRDEDVRPYINPIAVRWFDIELPAEYREVEAVLKEMLSEQIKALKDCGLLRFRQKAITKKDLLALGGELRQRIDQGEGGSLYNLVSVQATAVSLSHCIELLTTQDISVLEEFLEKLKADKAKYVRRIVNHPKFASLTQLIEKYKGLDHPKLPRLKSLVSEEFNSNPDSRIIVFTQYRNTASKILNELKTVDGARPVRFVGQATKGKDIGLKQKEQIDIIQRFKDGEFNVLVATQIAEEGIDLPSVMRVVFYEPIPSEIRLIQRRGRTGRKEAGRVDILIAKKSMDEAFYWSSIRREKQMGKIVSNLNLSLGQRVKRKGLEKPEAEPKEVPVSRGVAPAPAPTDETSAESLGKTLKWVMKRLQESSKEEENGIDVDILMEEAELFDMRKETISMAIWHLEREGVIYHPNPNRVCLI